VGGCDRSESKPAPAPAKSAPRPAKVELGTVGSGDLVDRWSFLGRVEPMQSAKLAPAVAGHVRQVSARVGDRIKRGAKLVTIDSAMARADLAASRAKERQLKAELDQAIRESERAAKITSRAISGPEKERLATRAATLDAQLAAQKAESQRLATVLSRHVVRAPFAGVISSRRVDPGAWVEAGTEVMELVATGDVEVLVDVSAALAPYVKAEQAATLLGDGDAQKTAATVAGVVPALDPATRTMRVRLRPNERPEWLLSGLAVNVEFPVSLTGRGVTVDRDALVRGPIKVRIIKVDDGHGKPIDVEVLATTKDRALVASDELKVGDKVVIRGNERLRPGQPLEVPEE